MMQDCNAGLINNPCKSLASFRPEELQPWLLYISCRFQTATIMKYAVTILFIMPFIACSQNTNEYQDHSEDTLNKYSYSIVGHYFNDTIQQATVYTGTGFFIINNNNRFLVTAKHVVIPCDENEMTGIRPNGYFVQTNNDSGMDMNNIRFWSINTLNEKKEYHCFDYWVQPDTISFLLKDSLPAYDISHIPIYDKSIKTSKIIIYGFPTANDTIGGGFHFAKAIEIESKDYVIDSNYIATYNHYSYKDTINYQIFLDDYKMTKYLQGVSGSPVFVENSVSKKWYFIGMIVAVDTRLNTMYVVKPKFLFH